MRRRLFTLASALCLLLCAATVVLWLRSYRVGERWMACRFRAYTVESSGGSVRLSTLLRYHVVDQVVSGEPETRTLSPYCDAWKAYYWNWEQPAPPDDRLFSAAWNEDQRGAAFNAGGMIFVRDDERASYVQAPHADWAVSGTGFGRFDLGDGRYLVVRYEDVGSMIRPGTRAASAEIAGIDDLTNDLPRDVARAVHLVHLGPSVNGERFDPAALVRAVNGLLPLGKQKALEALRFYSRLGNADFQLRWRYDIDVQRVLLIARLLFVPGDGAGRMPPMLIGGAVPDIGESAPDWPIYPLAVQDDLPFCLVCGYVVIGGKPQSPLVPLDFCERNCVMRTGPLVPKGSPAAAVDALCGSQRWRRSLRGHESDGQLKGLLRRQALLSVRNLWANRPDFSRLEAQQAREADGVWAEYARAGLLAGAKWDMSRQRFTFQN